MAKRFYPEDITSVEMIEWHCNDLVEKFRKHRNNQLDQALIKRIIRALALRGPVLLLPKEHVELVDKFLLPFAQRLDDEYRVGFDIALVLQLFEVAGRSFTKLERGWRRVQITEMALRDGLACGEHPERHFAAAVRLAIECRFQVGGPLLMSKVVELGKQHDLPLMLKDRNREEHYE